MSRRWVDELEYLTAAFIVRRGVLPLEDHLELLRQQVEEIEDHLDAGRADKALAEFVDCISLAHGAVHEHAEEPSEVMENRLDDIADRFDTIVVRPVDPATEAGS